MVGSAGSAGGARVLVAMSGGVDSSVAAARLLEAGYDIAGVTMKLWGGPSDTGCCSVSDVDDARWVADQLGIEHHVFNFGDDFERHVVAPYVADHAAGLTPNPVRRVQPAHQVQPAPAPGRRAWLRPRSDRPPRPHRQQVRRAPAGPGRRRGQGPVVRPAHARRVCAGPAAAAGGGDDQGRSPARGGGSGPGHGPQARQPGRVLHHRFGGPPEGSSASASR